jgi:hypothetical protein
MAVPALVAALGRQASFLAHLMRACYLEQGFLRQAAGRYVRFLALAKRRTQAGEAPGLLVPMYDIDLMWHTHMVRRRGSWEREGARALCKSLCGRAGAMLLQLDGALLTLCWLCVHKHAGAQPCRSCLAGCLMHHFAGCDRCGTCAVPHPPVQATSGSYERDTRRLLGKLFTHSDKHPGDALQQHFAATKAAYEAAYGLVYDPPPTRAVPLHVSHPAAALAALYLQHSFAAPEAMLQHPQRLLPEGASGAELWAAACGRSSFADTGRCGAEALFLLWALNSALWNRITTPTCSSLLAACCSCFSFLFPKPPTNTVLVSSEFCMFAAR